MQQTGPVEHHQEQIEQLELGMAKVIADFRAQAEEVREEEIRKSYHRIRKLRLLDAWGVCRYLVSGPWILCGFLVQIWISDIFERFVTCLKKFW